MTNGLENDQSPAFLRFTDQEYERRMSILRRMMDERQLDGVLLAGSPAYMSGGYGAFWVSGYPERIGVVSYVFLPREGEPTLFIPFAGSHVRSAKKIAFIQDVRHSQHGQYVHVIRQRIKELNLSSGQIGYTELDARYGLGIPYDLYQGLHQIPQIKWIPLKGVLEPLWMTKSPEEIQAIEHATRICDDTLQVLHERLKPGLRDYQVRGLIAGAIMEQRGELAFAIVGSTSMSDPQFPFPYSIESSRVIQRGDLVLNEFGARYMGYEGQTGRPFSMGPPTPEYKDLWEVTLQGAYALEQALRPGALATDIQMAGRKVFEEAGFVISAPMLHTLGICLSDPTVFFDHISGNPKFEFRPGMVVSLQSNPATPDQSRGLFMGNDYVVTETGCRRLSTTPFEFFEIEKT